MVASLITEPAFYAIAVPAVVMLGLAKGGFSGVGTAATPMLALYMPPLEASALLLPILLSQDVISLYAFRREWDAWNLKVMLPGALAPRRLVMPRKMGAVTLFENITGPGP